VNRCAPVRSNDYANFAPIVPATRSTGGLRRSAKPRRRRNLMPHIYEAVKSYATLGEICAALRDVFGTYEEVAVT